eukprot:37792_1
MSRKRSLEISGNVDNSNPIQIKRRRITSSHLIRKIKITNRLCHEIRYRLLSEFNRTTNRELYDRIANDIYKENQNLNNQQKQNQFKINVKGLGASGIVNGLANINGNIDGDVHGNMNGNIDGNFKGGGGGVFGIGGGGLSGGLTGVGNGNAIGTLDGNLGGHGNITGNSGLDYLSGNLHIEEHKNNTNYNKNKNRIFMSDCAYSNVTNKTVKVEHGFSVLNAEDSVELDIAVSTANPVTYLSVIHPNNNSKIEDNRPSETNEWIICMRNGQIKIKTKEEEIDEFENDRFYITLKKWGLEEYAFNFHLHKYTDDTLWFDLYQNEDIMVNQLQMKQGDIVTFKERWEENNLVIRENKTEIFSGGWHVYTTIRICKNGILKVDPTIVNPKDLSISGGSLFLRAKTVQIDGVIDVTGCGHVGFDNLVKGYPRDNEYGGCGGKSREIVCNYQTDAWQGKFFLHIGEGGGNGAHEKGYGGNGGGVVVIVAEKLELKGKICTNGIDGKFGGGGGSGGNVLIFLPNDSVKQSVSKIEIKGGC